MRILFFARYLWLCSKSVLKHYGKNIGVNGKLSRGVLLLLLTDSLKNVAESNLPLDLRSHYQHSGYLTWIFETNRAIAQPGLRGLTEANLFRIRQFYETYQDDQ